MSGIVAQLSCQQCQQRKRKCDKQTPSCSSCLKAGITCVRVRRQRLPRGRSGHQTSPIDNALKNRLDRLEETVRKLQTQAPTTGSVSTVRLHTHVNSPSAIEFFIAHDFWEELTDTITGIRNVFESHQPLADKEESSFIENNSSEIIAQTPSPVVLFPADASAPKMKVSFTMQEYLMDVYRERVDPMFKVLHWPSAEMLSKTASSSNNISPDVEALLNAIRFTAVCSLMDHEIEDCKTLITEYRRDVENAFTRADLLTTTSMVVLQAFIIYLAGLRACQSNAQQWTLTATALRIAQAQKIPIGSGTYSPLDSEVRRRIWFSIGLLDMQASFDRGSQPLLASSDFQDWPLNIDDIEIDAHSAPLNVQDNKFTDMSFSLLVYRAGICQRKLTELGVSMNLGAIDPIVAGNEQTNTLAEFERHVRAIPRTCSTNPRPIETFTMAVAEESLVAMRLLMHRPLYKRNNQTHRTSIPDINILATATEVLERSQYKRFSGEFIQWAWFSWVKWYALAIVLAELCVVQGPTAEHSWAVVQRSFDDYARIVADTKTGLLWKPIVKLMSRVKEIRAERESTGLKATAQGDEPAFSNRPFQDPDFVEFVHQSTDNLMQTDDMSWLHWDSLIDDLDDPDLFSGYINLDMLAPTDDNT